MMLRSRKPRKTLIAGVLNATSTRWGGENKNKMGVIVNEWLDETDMEVVNNPGKITFQRKEQASVIYVTFRTLNLEVRD